MLFLSQAERRRCRSAISSDAFGVVTAALLLAALALLPGLCPLAFAQDVKRAVVGHASSEVRVDGVLDEPGWAAAPVIGEIVQREPRPGDVATELTEVKLLYDENFLYIGVTCFDSEPDRIIGTRMARDSNLADDDRIEILVDPYRDRRNAFYFATNPLGALVDGLIIENGTLNRDWDSIWVVRTHKTEDGWTAEFAIPFKSLSFRAGQNVWGFNFSRTIKRKFEEGRWASPRLDTNFLQVSEAGEITGIEEITQGSGLDVRPFVSGRWLRTTESGHNTATGKPGLDLSYNLTSNLKWTSTFNTDFGETEADSRQVNLTRFRLFFPEKRSFFIENAGVFNFSNTFSRSSPESMRLLPFFSRRIGLVSNQEVPILAGTKLTGKIGRTDVGILLVRTKEASFVGAKNFLVGRVKQNILRQSYIGVLFTQGDPSLPITARTYGADVRLATSRFLGGNRNFVLNLYGLKTNTQGTSGDDASYGFSVEYPNDLLNGHFIWREVQENFRPALGFVSRTNVRYLQTSIGYDPRPEGFLNVRQMLHGILFTGYTRLDTHQLESTRMRITPFDWTFNTGDRLELNFGPKTERLIAPFEISPGVILPPGNFRFWRWRLEGQSATKRPVSVFAWIRSGTFWSGHADEISLNLNLSIAPRFQMSWRSNQTFARLPEGNFVARVFSVRVDYSLTPFTSFTNLVQYDSESRNLGWQSRFRWILQPGNDLFVVFNQGWQQDPLEGLHLAAADTKLAAKIQYTFRF